jgi:MarR family transcriptional regulator for hemolysin
LDKFHRDLLFLLHDVARLLRVDADKRARCHGMTRAQWAILIRLERQPGISQKELSEILEVEPITVARLIDRLEARGMVERRPDPKDRRIWRLHLLPPACDVLREIDGQRAEMTRMVTVGIDQDSIEIMTEALMRMKATLTQEAHASRRGAEEVQASRRGAEEAHASRRGADGAHESRRGADGAHESRRGADAAVTEAREAV